MSEGKRNWLGVKTLSDEEKDWKSKFNEASKENERLREELSSVDSELKTSQLNHKIQEHQRELANAQIEVLQLQVEHLLAWQKIQLERMKKEATIETVKRGRVEAGEPVEGYAS